MAWGMSNGIGPEGLKGPPGGPSLASPCPIIIYRGGGVVLSCPRLISFMLKLLRISNIAIISELEMEFAPGLTLLTGETGAGKSILVDAELEALRRDRREAERRREMLDYQAAEIERAHLAAGEEEALREEKRLQASAGRRADLSGEAFRLLYDDEDAVSSRLGQVYRRVEELASIDPRLAPHLETRETVRAHLDELALFLRDYREGLPVSPGRLDEIESRLALIERLKRKYGATAEEVVAFGARCRADLDALGSPEEREAALQREREELAARYLAPARVLSRNRRVAARELEKKVQSELGQLAMEKTRFRVQFQPDVAGDDDSAVWTERGLETAEFLLSPNPGEELRPLARIASGGELSRILLALKSVATRDDPEVGK